MSFCDHLEKITRQTGDTFKCEHDSNASVYVCLHVYVCPCKMK